MSERYKVVADSQSGHCCFGGTVVDTAKPGVGHDSYGICECWDLEEAELIADALNYYTAAGMHLPEREHEEAE